MVVFVSKNIEALENMVEDKPHFLTEVVDNRLSALTMIAKHFMSQNERDCEVLMVKDVVALVEEVVPWREEAATVVMMPVVEKSMVKGMFWECLKDDSGIFLSTGQPVLPVPFIEWNWRSLMKGTSCLLLKENNGVWMRKWRIGFLLRSMAPLLSQRTASVVEMAKAVCFLENRDEGLLRSTDDESFDQYVSCLSGKMTRKSFLHRPEKATDLLGIIHTDVCGPLIHVSRQGASYFITFTDEYSCYGYVYLLKHKHEVFEKFKVFKNEMENQLGKTIKALRSDRDGEYISQEFKYYLKACGIVQQLTPPYTPQHNGMSERRNRTLLYMVRSMMNLISLSLSFWDYALESAKCILYMGCEALVKWDTLDKLQQRSVKCIFIGYLKETMGYYFYFPPENKIVVARYAEFFEKNLVTQEVEEHSLWDLNEPASYEAAMLDSESNKWIDAMNVEIQSMIDNMVWVLVDLPPNCKTVESKWIFKKKTDMDGIIHTYKARLVAKGYTQLYGIDYEETLTLVTDIRAIRILISIAAFYDYEIWQMDVKTVFLNGYLDKDIYMVQPKGFVDPNYPRKASGSNVTFLILYVDETIILGNHIPCLQSVKHYLGKCFAMKDLGEVAFIHGIKIYRNRSKRLTGLGQNDYMDKLLKRYKMDNSKRGHIPMQEKLDLNKTQGASTPKELKRMQNVPNASAVGFIIGMEKFQAKYY
uniref:Integrase catalytic domain-containing protein n=1 Tax=Tanacetum cinerariifolium TaxID=118510 RepID=A0A699H781_TANCI|nr:hypothetical protein [Tanacetum cinerariifolium]